jgi:phosphinothricin acetyltransferase
MIIRDAVDDDMPAVKDIYNALIPTTTIAWTETRQTLRQRRTWYRQQQRDGHPVLVADDEGDVIGFAAYGSFRGSGKWPGYRFTVEHTIHVRESHWGMGVGRRLLTALVERARLAGVHVMVGAIDGDNVASIRFHESLGFSVVARMPEIGYKFERRLDLVLVQRVLGRPAPAVSGCGDG